VAGACFRPKRLERSLLFGRKTLQSEYGDIPMLGEYPAECGFQLQEDEAGEQRESSRFPH
jgi:hypothetical protein